ncbi:MAG: hypothetical protein GY854_31150, partial [Deltaproteobacteria bacterium]|nr:hypothetical protein [Deltaproteobacteria bacterium]
WAGAGSYLLEEAGETLFEEATGIPVIVGPDDLAEALIKKGVRKEVADQTQDAMRRSMKDQCDPVKIPHKNSLDYVGDTHVYRIKGPKGTHKIGESAQGVRVRDGASIRGEQQARRLTRETGDFHRSDIRKTFPDKRSARDYETQTIERFRRMFGDDALPGNKTNR